MIKSPKLKKFAFYALIFAAGMIANRPVRQNVPGANRLPEL
ncbi:hypothetical protein VDG1235_1966 [Verrucomicrobiia bacterium DG1235]|nr:hypothetical protein VDG1235_1966 [Verrucomicrobiae bacterium DG1235]